MFKSVFSKVLGIPFVTDLVKGIANLGYKNLKDNNEVLKFLADHGLENPKDENRSLYIHTLIIFQAQVGNEEYFKVLISEDSFMVFASSYIISNDKEPFIIHVEIELTSQYPDDANGFQQNIHRNALEEFFLIYDALLKKVASPTMNSLLSNFESFSKAQGEANIAIIERLDSQDDPLIKSQINFFNGYLDQRKFKEGLLALENLETQIYHIKNPEFRSTLLINIGYCHFELGDKDEAGKYFKKAYEANNNSYTALCNYSQALDVNSEFELAERLIKNAVSLYGESNSEVWEGFILVMRKKYEVSSFIKEIPLKFLSNANIQRALAIAYRIEGNFDNYFRCIETAYSTNPELGNIKIAFIESKILEYQTDYRIFNLRSINSNLQSEIERLIEMVEFIIDSENDATDAKLFLIQAKATFLYLIHKEKEALEFILSIETEYSLDRQKLYRLKSMLLLMDHQIEEAFSLIEKYVGVYGDLDDVMMHFEIANHLDFNESMQRSFFKIESSKDHIHLYQAMYIYIVRYKKYDDHENLEKLSVEIKKYEGIEFRVLEARILFYLNSEEFENLLSIIEKHSDDEIRISVIHDIIDLYERAEKWEKAILFMEKRFDLNDYEPLTDRYINAVSQLGDNVKLLNVFENIRLRKGVHLKYTLKECDIYTDNYQYDKAISIAKEYLKVYSERIDVALQISFLQFQVKDFIGVDEFLGEIIDLNKLTDTELNNYLVLLALRENTQKCLNILYDNHRKNYTARSNDLYLTFWFKYGFSGHVISPTKIVENTAVVIFDGEHERRTLLITDPEIEPISSRNEISINDPLILAILGKGVKDQFEMKDVFLSKNWIIESIENKFSFQFRKCLTDAGGVFKREGTIKSFHIDDLKKMIENLAAHTSQDPFSQVIHYYQSGQCGIGTLSEGFQEDPLSIRVQILSRHFQFISSLGSWEDQVLPETMNFNNGIVLDVTAISTLFDLNILEVVCEKFKKLIIARSAYEIFYQRFMQSNFGSNSIAEDEDPLLKLLNEHFEIEIPDTISLNNKEKENFVKNFGKSFYESALIAQKENAIYYSDDLFARNGCSEILSLDSCWTIPILKYLKKNDLIDSDLFQDSILKLVKLNYRFVDITSDTMLYCLKMNNYKISHTFDQVISLLNGNISNLNSALSTFINFVEQIVKLEELSEIDLVKITNYVLSYLFTDRHLNQVNSQYLKLISEKKRSLKYMQYMKMIMDNFLNQYSVGNSSIEAS